MILLLVILFLLKPTLQHSSVEPELLTVFLNVEETFELRSKVTLKSDTTILFENHTVVDILTPLKFHAKTQRGTIRLKGVDVKTAQELKPKNCSSAHSDDCSAILAKFYLSVSVLKYSSVEAILMIVGWAYSTSWTVSFYPQAVLNYKRKSVIGLNFDFVVYNVIGFAAYSVYNCFLYFDENTQRIYEEAHPHSPIPVLINDVFFGTQAFAVCTFTAYQVLIYERGDQRVSYITQFLTAIMLVGTVVAGVATWYGTLNMLQFITGLAYVKMAVTLFKYIPQALLNFRRKSTAGWSIALVLLDFNGGCLAISQMVLQCWNADEWSAFYGNPVKFGLGIISCAFDVLFMIQHYILYPHATEDKPEDLEKSGTQELSGKSQTEKRSGSDRNSTSKSAAEKSNTSQNTKER
ncbi:Lysosomal Cystine Transporter [Trichostrongylus colubriformis]|uniref:Lysosomal Cystine Transporter n=1 Tax=Trichostrongylus colubriformis TaxID=6319 RepID=A0AAN8FI43_TRICO